MGWWGKAVGGTLGLLVGGPWGALIGATLGHGLDRGAEQLDLFGSLWMDERTNSEGLFVATTFKVLGHLAKRDGRVSEAEIDFAESIMARLGLTGQGRRAAIDYFNQGKAAGFAPGAAATAFRAACPGQQRLHLVMLEILLTSVYLRGAPTPAERLILEQVRAALQFPLHRFRQVERVIQIQYQGLDDAAGGTDGRTQGGQPGAGRSGAVTPLARAYGVLGVTSAATDAEVKRAYRLLMNAHHPDKLIARGASAETLQVAAQKTHEIRQAYEAITRARAPA
jgi:DnaJ like chaperone protein